jgi:RNA polymerase sigma factor (sigma-70 family)
MHMSPSETKAEFVMRLFESYYDRVYAFARKSAPADIAEDVTQEVFIRLLQHPRLEELTLSVSYLIKISHNLLRRRHSRSVRLRELLATAVTDDLIDRHGRPDRTSRNVSRSEDLESEKLEEAMSTLTNDERDAIRLIVWEGKSYEHAAMSLDVSVTTINNWKHRGLSKLRKHVEQPANDSRIRSIEVA